MIALEVVHAQPIKNGFQLINTKSEKVYEILHTTVRDVFILKMRRFKLFI